MSKKIDCADLEKLILEQMAKWRIPGLAVGIVQDGEILLKKGLGLRNVEKGLGVTTDTLFPIGSSTKAFTSLCIALLVDDGKLDWDTPIKQYLPDFKMYDAFTGDRLTVRDMLCHRSGLPRHEFMWYRASLTRKDIMERMQYAEPNKDFRTTWQYNNAMYASLGYLIEKVSGMSWEELVRTRIFEPLHMTGSNFSVETLKKTVNAALPYAERGEHVEQIDYCNLDVIGPAGSINSNLTDMLQWLKLHLNCGSADGKQLVSKESMAQLHEMQIPCQPFAWKFDEIQASGYALGWFTDVFRGRKMVSHGGNIDGFTALVGFLPDENVGVVLLSDLNYNFMNYPLLYTIFDRALGAEGGNWFDREKKEFTAFLNMMNEAQQKQMTGDSSEAESVPAQQLAKYAGAYQSACYGNVEIRAEGENLVMHFNQTDFPMVHKTGDTFSFSYELLSIAFPVTFHIGTGGEINSLSIPFEPSVHDIMFQRV